MQAPLEGAAGTAVTVTVNGGDSRARLLSARLVLSEGLWPREQEWVGQGGFPAADSCPAVSILVISTCPDLTPRNHVTCKN